MIRLVVLTFTLLFAVACQGGSGGATDGSMDDPATDAGDGSGTGDGGNGPFLDGGPDEVSDAAVVPPDANLAFEPVDCRGDDDCLGELTCDLDSPGGICNGCAEPADCGDGFGCRFGACTRDCADDTDCSPGKRCNFGGTCTQRRCSDNNPCPEPYVCDPNSTFNRFCVRPACGADDSCPGGFTCLVSEQLCVEP